MDIIIWRFNAVASSCTTSIDVLWNIFVCVHARLILDFSLLCCVWVRIYTYSGFCSQSGKTCYLMLSQSRDWMLKLLYCLGLWEATETPVNSISHGWCSCTFKSEIFKAISRRDILGIQLMNATHDLGNDYSALFQVMAWCRQALSHYLRQHWSRFFSLYGFIRPQWVKSDG